MFVFHVTVYVCSAPKKNFRRHMSAASTVPVQNALLVPKIALRVLLVTPLRRTSVKNVCVSCNCICMQSFEKNSGRHMSDASAVQVQNVLPVPKIASRFLLVTPLRRTFVGKICVSSNCICMQSSEKQFSSTYVSREHCPSAECSFGSNNSIASFVGDTVEENFCKKCLCFM